MVINADYDTLSSMYSPAENWRKVVWKGQLLYSRTLYNLFVCLKILIGEKVFYGKLENWDQIAPLHSPRVRGTTSKFGKERSIARRHSKVWNSRAQPVRSKVWGGDTRRNVAPRTTCSRSFMVFGEECLEARKIGTQQRSSHLQKFGH